MLRINLAPGMRSIGPKSGVQFLIPQSAPAGASSVSNLNLVDDNNAQATNERHLYRISSQSKWIFFFFFFFFLFFILFIYYFYFIWISILISIFNFNSGLISDFNFNFLQKEKQKRVHTALYMYIRTEKGKAKQNCTAFALGISIAHTLHIALALFHSTLSNLVFYCFF